MLGRRIGFWRPKEGEEKGEEKWSHLEDLRLPWPGDHVDAAWMGSSEWRDTIAYLKGGEVAASWRGSSTCRLCGMFPNGSQDLSDGAYLWPDGFAHYVEAHGVKPPAQFLEHMRSRRTSSSGAWLRPGKPPIPNPHLDALAIVSQTRRGAPREDLLSARKLASRRGLRATVRAIDERLASTLGEDAPRSTSDARKGAAALALFAGMTAAFFFGTRGPRVRESKRTAYWREWQPVERAARGY